MSNARKVKKKLFALPQVKIPRLLFFTLSFFILVIGGLIFSSQSIQAGLSYGWKQIIRGTPRMMIQKQENRGGLITLASTADPTIEVGSWEVSGDATFTLFQASEETLLKYLQYNDEGKQSGGQIDTSVLTQVTSFQQFLGSGYDSASKISLPLSESGIWYLTIRTGDLVRDVMIIRSPIGLLSKEGDNQFILWGQDFRTKRKLTSGTVSLYGLKNQRTDLGSTVLDDRGIGTLPINKDVDIALLRSGGHIAVIPINLKYLNSGSVSYRIFRPKEREVKYFTFTDRPLYQPGDTLYFKSVLRDDDDARYTIPTGLVRTRIIKDWDFQHPVFDQNLPISDQGSVHGEFQLPSDINPGYYTVIIDALSDQVEANRDYSNFYGSASFQVEYFRKPEYFLELEGEGFEYHRGDQMKLNLSGAFFSGQPLSSQEVKYTVDSSDFYEYDYFSDYQWLPDDKYRYGNWGRGNKLKEDFVSLNTQGEAEIVLDTSKFEMNGKSKVITVEASFLDASQNPVLARKNFIVYAGKVAIYRQPTGSYQGKINELYTLPLELRSRKQESVANIEVEVKIKRETWVSYIDPNQKYPQYRQETADYPSQKITTNQSGQASVSFTPDKTGYYRFSVEVKDPTGNPVVKEFGAWISEFDVPYYNDGQSSYLSINPDKEMYQPGESARLTLTSTIPDIDVLLAIQRGRVDRYQVVSFSGKNAEVNIPLDADDMPNIFARVSGFSDGGFDSVSVRLPVSAQQKKIQVGIQSEKKTYGPGETAVIDVYTKDQAGNPVGGAEVAVWSVDKALFELADSQLQNIFETFWIERWENTEEAHSLEGINVFNAEGGGGCFTADTQILMVNGKTKSIEDVKKGDWILTRANEYSSELIKAKVTDTHEEQEDGYLSINGNLEITPNHILWVNGAWQTADQIQIGDQLRSSNDQEVTVDSIEWLRKPVTVYNLSVEKYQTFFADGVWVHNQKSDVRKQFEDVAYWNPVVRTDANGYAQIRFTLPDNLTTWVVAGVAATTDTKVGQSTAELTVQKDIVVRPILPNIIRVGDEIELSAVIHNFTDEAQTFDVDFGFTGGEIQEDAQRQVEIAGQASQQLFWDVLATKEEEKAEVTISAKSTTQTDRADSIIVQIPVRKFGYYQRSAQVGDGSTEYEVRFNSDSDPQKSSAKLLLSSTLVGSLPDAMKYLVDYPYGCVEQTTSRLVPVLIAKKYPKYFAALQSEEMDEMVKKGISKLGEHQLSNGGWNWWGHDQTADAFVTAYVIESLVTAKELGYQVPEEMINRATNYLTSSSSYVRGNEVRDSAEEFIMKNYALTVLGQGVSSVTSLTDLNQLPADVVAYAVLTNVKRGDSNSQTNGLQILLDKRKTEGDRVFWEGGTQRRFGSTNTSTALAVRAILAGNGDRTLASQAVRFLLRNQQNVYWSNTFATAQVMKSLSEFAQTGNESAPNYSYLVSLDGEQISQGSVDASTAWSPSVPIPLDKIQESGSTISLQQNGQGQLYSTFVQEEFRTAHLTKPFGNGILITREYESDRGAQYSLSVGDTVTVKLKIYGTETDQNYALIHDHLPAGLIPINTVFNNEQANEMNPSYEYRVDKREFTEDGVIISLYELRPGVHTFTYKARVVSAGTFAVPPAHAELMYAPEIYAYSQSDTITVTGTPKIILSKAAALALERWSDRIWNFLRSLISSPFVLLGILAIGLLLAGIAVVIRRRRRLKALHSSVGSISEIPESKPPDLQT